MKQTKLISLIEVCVNVATGFVIAMCVWMFIIPIFYPRMEGPVNESFIITAIFTVASIARGYIWRRFFNAGFHRTVVNWVGKLWGRKAEKLGCENKHLGAALGNIPCPDCGNDIWVGPKS